MFCSRAHRPAWAGVSDWLSRRLHVCTMAAVWFVVASFGEQLGTNHTLDSGVQ